MDYKNEYKRKLVSADEAVKVVKSGELQGVNIRAVCCPFPPQTVVNDPERKHFIFNDWHFSGEVIGVGKKIKDEAGITLNIGTFEQDGNINTSGSGIGLGHPVGCTALRIIVSLYYELERLGKTVGGASLCVGGGPALASLWTRDI